MMASHPQPAYNFLEVPFNLLFRDQYEQKKAQMQNNEKMLSNSNKQITLLIWLSWSMQVGVPDVVMSLKERGNIETVVCYKH